MTLVKELTQCKEPKSLPLPLCTWLAVENGGSAAARHAKRPQTSQLKLFKVLNGTHKVSAKEDVQTVVWADPDAEFLFLCLWVNTMDESFETGMQGCSGQQSPN